MRSIFPLLAFVLGLPLAAASGAVDFAHEVLPILKQRCAECHSNGKYKGGVSLDTREALLGSDDAVVVGDASKSLLIEVLTLEDPDERMPQKAEALPAEEIAVLTRWVNEGLAWEPGFTFREKTWVAPLAPRKPALPGPEGGNPVDRIAGAYFGAQGVSAPVGISDATFLRRVSLDLLGVLPTREEVAGFDGDRTAKVAALLGREIDYADHWMTFWNDLLRNDYAGTGFIDGGRKQITAWLYAALLENKPYDQFVSELMSPSGGSEGFIKGIKWRGNVNASQVQEVQYAQNVSQVFFGENLKCASCHDSFINDWKLEDAYGMASIIAGKPLEMFRCDKPTGRFADAKFLFDELGEISRDAPKNERLKQAAALATSKANGRLARTVVNRLWARLMGRGLVEPVDIMGNRPWSEDMLDYLAWDLAENGYDLKRTLALIVNSRTYQSATVAPPGETEDYVFKGPIAKRMTAEQFIDAVWEITGTKPGKVDAGVKRVAPPVVREAKAVASVEDAKWIWSAKGDRPAGEKVVFTHEFEMLSKFSGASMAITCDNEYVLFLNGKEVGRDSNWENVERYDVARFLKKGQRNVIRVEAKNLGSSPGPAGLIVALRADGVSDKAFEVVSGANWKAGDGNAVVLGGAVWGKVFDQAPAPASNALPVRASLVKSTLLMRALGRPNREQVVTTRPAELTTLQALELNNGAEFVGYLERGASKWCEEYAGRYEEMVGVLYGAALSREPSPMERDVARQMLGSPVTKDGVADLMWTVLMLPEFQFVR